MCTIYGNILLLIHSMIDTKEVISTIQQFNSKNPNGVIIIRWATATWKTWLSVELAEQFPFEIISADSRQIYTKMDIWTDKISKEIREKVPHHMIDIVDPKETYTAGQWKADVEHLIPQIHTRKNIPCIVWWTGLYIDTIYKNFSMPEVAPDPIWRETMMEQEAAHPWFLLEILQKVDPNEAMKHHANSTRYLLRALEIFEKTWTPKSEIAKELPVKRPLLMIWLRRDKESTNKLINARIKEMTTSWLIEEVQWLLNAWYSNEHVAMNGIWYKEITGYLQWAYTMEKAIELLKRNSHRYAKRQRSWFRRYIAQGIQTPKENVQYMVIEL